MESPFGSIGDASTFLARAELMFDLDRFDDAREELGGALSSDPAHVPSLTLLAVLELLVGNHDEALTAASAALAAEPTHETAILARGHALALLRRTEEALEAADQIQQRNPESWWHNVHFALLVQESRNGQDALDAAWVAVRLAPEEARAHLTLALVSQRLGLEDLALRARAAAHRLDPQVLSLLEGDTGPLMLRGRSGRMTARGGSHRQWPQEEPAISAPPLPSPVVKWLRTVSAVGLVVPVLAALWSNGQVDSSRLIAGFGAAAGIAVMVLLFRRLPVDLRDGMRVMAERDRWLRVAIVAAACSPLLAGVYAFLGVVLLLAAAMLSAMLCLVAVLLRR